MLDLLRRVRSARPEEKRLVVSLQEMPNGSFIAEMGTEEWTKMSYSDTPEKALSGLNLRVVREVLATDARASRQQDF